MKVQTDNLQRAFIRSTFFLELVQMATGCTRKQAEYYRPVFRTMLQDITEAKLKAFLYMCLACYDLTPQERAEIRTILRQADTFLTEQQAASIRQLF